MPSGHPAHRGDSGQERSDATAACSRRRGVQVPGWGAWLQSQPLHTDTSRGLPASESSQMSWEDVQSWGGREGWSGWWRAVSAPWRATCSLSGVCRAQPGSLDLDQGTSESSASRLQMLCSLEPIWALSPPSIPPLKGIQYPTPVIWFREPILNQS